MNKILIAGALTGALLSGCATTYPSASIQPADGSPDQVDLTPPVPSFMTLADCERAYGLDACGTGDQLYQTAGIVVPVDAYGWYAPYAFGVMTGVLVNHYFAPPGVYEYGVEYQRFASTTAVNSYKTVNQTTINNFKQAPLSARNQALRAGPVGYSRSKGSVTGPARLSGTAPSHAQNATYTSSSTPASHSSTSSSYNYGGSTRAAAATYTAPVHTVTRSSSAYSYSPPTLPAPSYTAPTRSAAPVYAPPRQSAPSYSAPRQAAPAYSAPRPATTYSAPQAGTAKVCTTYPCR